MSELLSNLASPNTGQDTPAQPHALDRRAEARAYVARQAAGERSASTAPDTRHWGVPTTAVAALSALVAAVSLTGAKLGNRHHVPELGTANTPDFIQPDHRGVLRTSGLDSLLKNTTEASKTP